MNIENAPWLFAPALVYAFGIVALTLVEIARKPLIPLKWKNRVIFVGMVPLVIMLLIAILSLAAEMLYLHPKYVTRQQEIRQLLNVAYAYNNNLLIMIPTGVFYFIVLSISQNKQFLFGVNNSGQNNYQMNATDDSIQASDSNAILRQREIEIERENKDLKRKDDEWRDGCVIDDNYWNNSSNP